MASNAILSPGIQSYHITGEEEDEYFFKFAAEKINFIKTELRSPDELNVLSSTLSMCPVSLHLVAFMPAMKMLSSEEQLAKWWPLIESYKIIGCYAQTELGHGSNVQSLETIVTVVE